ncbi:OmpA family protein [Rhodovulum kholense]|uniref:Outer membrane protein OmpA-like peptidoglycan-associated protein n=1 Tax=Rhodovulum kholense TaxID=453584 RepID=A0A8E2VKX2_9RHOB|nr:OmpA family protein [Rhodovulum kholense]PTW50783.1 outer membrane protein OmpA-like peptidoglycan-associated protein [Rhodovulum kholense]
MRARLAFVTLGAALALTACSPRQIADFNRPAGDALDDGSFGNATMTNQMVMTSDRAMAIDMTRRFAAEVPSTVTFAFDSAALDATAQAALDRQAAWILRYPFVVFRVYGHADKVGSAPYNKALGMRRAQAAVAYMVARGVPRARLQAVVSYGETRPLVHTEGPERLNRRTVTEVAAFLRPRPMTIDGKYMARSYRAYLDSAQPKPTLQPADVAAQD